MQGNGNQGVLTLRETAYSRYHLQGRQPGCIRGARFVQRGPAVPLGYAFPGDRGEVLRETIPHCAGPEALERVPEPGAVPVGPIAHLVEEPPHRFGDPDDFRDRDPFEDLVRKS